ncbi:MAG: SRPBCC domain-containing protein [Xanthomarina gelatinilytica]|uniref:SRPBCC domain-containing protein n=1 Tax=Xanthomarina gelatinilytica TaxID=1137281 RepID=UPI003A863D1A
MKEYIIKKNINASKETVWNVITDFENYPKWNSVLKMDNNANLVLGDKFDVSIEQPNTKQSNFKATATGKEEFQSFSASQKIVGKWFFQATHFFIVEEVDEEHVTFIQKWELKGIISSLFRKQIFKELEVFKIMNKELKEFIEE